MARSTPLGFQRDSIHGEVGYMLNTFSSSGQSLAKSMFQNQNILPRPRLFMFSCTVESEGLSSTVVKGEIPGNDNSLCLLGAFCEQGIRLSPFSACCHLILTKF